MNAPMTPERLAEIAARVAAAAPGPWETELLPGPGGGIGVATEGELELWVIPVEDLDPADVAFIAAARTDVPDLLAEVERLTAALTDNAQKLVDGWKHSSQDHAQFAQSKAVDDMPGFAAKQEGRSLQLLDCADELADVLKGEDPDDWEYGVGMDVLDRGEREAGDPR